MKVTFKNGHSLHLAKPDTKIPDNCYCYVISSSDKKRVDVKGNPLAVKAVNLRRISSENYRYFQDASTAIRKSLAGADCYILYDEKDYDSASTFFHIVLINPAKPENNLSIARGSGADIVRRYISYLENKSGQPSEKIIKTGTSIRAKLLSITFIIIIIALSAVIFPAAWISQKYSELLIQEYNLSLARLIGKSVESDIRNIMYKSRNYMNNPKHNDDFFRANQEIIHIETISPGDVYKPNKPYTNSYYTRLYNITREKISGAVSSRYSLVSQSFGGRTILTNISASLNIPVVLISEPYRDGMVLIAVVSSAKLLEVFQNTRQTDLFELMMINPSGETIAHTDQRIILENRNLLNDPVVAGIFKTGLDNGSRKYTYQDREYLASWQSLEYGDLGVVSRVPSSRVFAAIYKIQRQNILIMLFVITASFLIVFLFARTISIPIIHLVGATRKIEQGDYNLTIENKSNDEIGILTNSFLAMAKGLEEKEKIKDAFGKFVNPEVAEMAIQGKLRLGGELKQATVFFSDIRNFTDMSERIRPGEIVDILNRYFTLMVECVHQTGGVVDKFIGDAVMAHWGAVEPTDNDAANAVKSALKMRNALIQLNREFLLEGKDPLAIGIGINTGPLIAGQIGSQTRLEYTVIGDAVNLASRIEYLNKTFGTDILVSETTYKLISGDFNFARLPEIKIRGKEKPQVVYAVLGLKNDPLSPLTLKELRERMGIQYSLADAEKVISESSDRLVGDLNNAD